VPTAMRARPLAAAELAAAVPGSVAVETRVLDEPPPAAACPPVEDDDELSLSLAAREPRTPPRTAPRMMASRSSGRPTQSHLFFFFFCGGA